MSPGPRARPQPLDHVGVAAAGHEADVLAVGLVGDGKPEAPRQLARLRLGALAERKAQELELLARGGEQEVALVALRLARAIKRAAAARQRARGDVVAGRQHLGAELARGREEIAELDRLVALDAGHRRFAGDIAFGEALDHRFLEAALVVEHVVRNAEALGDRAGVVDVLAGATGALAVGRRAMVVELQRDADHVIAGLGEQRRGDRGIDPARHRDDNARVRRPTLDIEPVEHGHTISAAPRRRHGRPLPCPCTGEFLRPAKFAACAQGVPRFAAGPPAQT